MSLQVVVTGQTPWLDHTMSEEEKSRMPEYLASIASRKVPSPPPIGVRTMGEWEQIQALVITWAGQTAILREIVRHAVKECKVLIVTNSPTNVETTLINAGIALDSVQLIDQPFNSIWVRDYGPWTVYKNDVDSLYIIDWIYNRPRPQDDAVPAGIAAYLGLPLYEATQFPNDWVHTGGNHLPDGMGTVFSSRLVLDENPTKSEGKIDSIAARFLGVDQYIKFPTLPFDGIHHLDMHMRLIDEETIIFGQYPDGVADGPQIEANIEYLLENFKTSFGNDYKIIRMPMPPDGNRYPDQGGDYRTYTNSIFLNKTILVPVYEERYDTTALRIYRENLPGYNVVGLNCNNIIGSLGALHCITKTVGVNQPLYIAHARLRDVEDTITEYPVSAIIKHVEGISNATLFYKSSKDSTYTGVEMMLSDTANHIWSGVIPSYAAGTEVRYYIHAKAYNGKEQVRPIVAPEGYFKFKVLGEPVNQPPVVVITHPLNGALFDILDASTQIAIGAEDIDGSIDKIQLFINGDSITTLTGAPFEFEWHFPAEGEYEIVATAVDDDGLSNTSVPVNINVQSLTATDHVDDKEIFIYPNPASEWVFLETHVKIGKVIVYDILGKMYVLSRIHDNTYDVSVLTAGVYVLKINVNDHWHTSVMLKQ